MKKYKEILMLTSLINSISFGNLARGDIDWDNYENFGMNVGKFVPGREGIIIYKSDGTVSGILDKPMPNFDGVVDAGYLSFWGDTQILTGVTHVGQALNKSLIKRHLRKDIELSAGYIEGVTKNKDTIYKDYSENYVTAYHKDFGQDYSVIRNTKIAFDGHLTETVENFSTEVKAGNLIARVGAGSNYYAIGIGDEVWVGPGSYGRMAGGLNLITSKAGHVWTSQGINNFGIYLEENPLTPMDSGTKPGDSGSPVFMWSESKNKWIIVGSNSAGLAGVTGGYTKGSVIRGSTLKVKEYTDAITDTPITDGHNITIENSLLTWANGSRNPDGTNMEYGKNQVFDTENAQINVVGSNDTGVSRFEFKKDATISGSGSLKTAGFVVEKGATLTYTMVDTKDNTVRKNGEGTLIMKGTAQNEGELNVGGEGVTILDNEHGYAASHIRMALGQKVVLNRENQLNGNKIYFGLRGGTLELKGQDLTFNDIYHIDEGAKIANNDSTKQSTFTFTQGNNRVFLGSFNGNLDVNYNPDTVVTDNKWDLRGNTTINGDLNVEKGNVSISGDNILYTFDLKIADNEYDSATFISNNINVKENAKLTINRAAKVDSNINISNNGKLDIVATGTILTEKDDKPDYVGAPKQEDINKIEIGNTINFGQSQGTNLFVNLENNNKAIINSKIMGTVTGEKTGAGRLELHNEDNNVTGTMNISEGKVWATSKLVLSNITNTINENGILEVDKVSSLAEVLENVDEKSSGILSLGESVNLDAEYQNYSNLFLGSSKNIVIGTEGTPINPNIKTINLGGDGGTVTLKGLEFDNQDETGIERNIIVGKANSTGTVILDKVVEENGKLGINVVVNNGYNFGINEKLTNRKFIDLNYGASTDYIFGKNISDDSEGFLTLSQNDKDVSVVKNTALGTKQGEEVTVNNITTDSVYRLAGEGILNIETQKLENKDIVVDAQYRSGGIVSISSEDKGYVGTISVMGNKNNENKGNITLKIGKEGSLGENNIFNVKDGGILDLNGTTLKAAFGENSNEYGEITSSVEDGILVLNNDKESKLVNKFTSNLDIEKNGAGIIEFTNVNNNFGTATNKGKVTINNGGLLYKTIGTLNENNEIILNNNSELILEANTIDSKVIINDGNILLDKIENPKIIKDLELNGNGLVNTLKDDKTVSNLSIENLSLNSNTLSLNNQDLVINNVNTKGSLEMTNSILNINDSSSDLLTKEKIENLFLNEDNNTLKFSNIAQEAIVNSNIIGEKNSAIEIEKDSGKVTITNNFKDFEGTLYLSENTKEENKVIDYKIDDENIDNRVINYSLAGDGTFKNISEKDLTFTQLNDFSGTLVGENGDIVLSGENALTNKTERAINDGGLKVIVTGNENLGTNGDTNIKLLSNTNISLDQIHLENKGGNENKVIKSGTGNITLEDNDNVKIINFGEVAVDDGILTLEKNILDESGKYTIDENANLVIDFKKENEIISNIEGDGSLTKIGENEINIRASKINNGNINIEEGILNINSDKTEKINTTIGIGENGTLSFTNSELKLSNVNNEGNINVINQNLEIENYSSKDGILNIQKDEIDNKKVTIGNNNGNINVNLALSNNVLEGLKDQKLTIVNSEDEINILNLGDYNKGKNYQLVLEKTARNNDIFGKIEGENENQIYSVLSPKTVNYLKLLNDLSNNSNNNKISYKNKFETNYINYGDSNKKYENFGNTEYKNKTEGNGLELVYENIDEKNDSIISKGAYISFVENKSETDVRTQELYKNKYKQLTLQPQIGIKKGIFDISTGLGITKLDINNGGEFYTLNNNLNIGINPKVKINENTELTYINNFGYNYNPIIKENISKIEETIDKIKIDSPLNLYYETGLKLENKFMELILGGEYRRNLSNISILNGEEQITNGLKNNWELLGKAQLSLKLQDNLKFNMGIQSTIYQNSKSNQLMKVGMEYNW